MKIKIALLVLLTSSLTIHAQQWDGLNDVNGQITRNGNIRVNWLWMGRYGSPYAGDANPYIFSVQNDGNPHDLTLFGSNEATLHLRVSDGQLRLGPNEVPNATIYNDGSAYFNRDVAIGSTTPSNVQGFNRVLDVRGSLHSKILATTQDATFRTGLYAHSSWQGGGGFVGTESNHSFHLMSNYSVKMSVLPNGNIGVGTQTPARRFHVYNSNTNAASHSYADLLVEDVNLGMVQILTSNTGTGYYSFADTDDDYVGGIQYNHTVDNTDKMMFFVNNGYRMTIDPSGRVGMGTQTPNARLHVFNTGSGGTPHSYTNFLVEDDDRPMINILTKNDGIGYLVFGDNDDGLVAGLEYDHTTDKFTFRSNNHASDMVIYNTGYVGIGLGLTEVADERLTVSGVVHSNEVRVDTDPEVVPDYVFEEDYNLLSLEQTEAYIKKHKHLPDVPSAAELGENGMNLKEMNLILLKKIEELTLHVIELEKEVKELKSSKK